MTLFEDLFDLIRSSPSRHSKDDALWRVLRAAARSAVEDTFAGEVPEPTAFGPYGSITFPFFKMGAIDSLDLFGIDELIILAYYDVNRRHYAKAVDFGANIGLHSLAMARCGFQVRSFEPDPTHFEVLERNLSLNHVETELHQAAVAVEAGKGEFVRVLGNTTGSHIAGAKDNPYGELERFEVMLEAAEPHLRWADLAKIDVEGYEATLLTGLPVDIWQTTDAVLEVGTAENADLIFQHFRETGINLISQLNGWSVVETPAQMPTSHRDGSLFITSKASMPWNRD